VGVSHRKVQGAIEISVDWNLTWRPESLDFRSAQAGMSYGQQ